VLELSKDIVRRSGSPDRNFGEGEPKVK